MSDDAEDLQLHKEDVFILEYVKDFNGTQAAIRAGYTANVKSAGEIASRLLKKVKVSRAIKAHVAERAMSADEVLIRLADIARGSMDDFISGNSINLTDAKINGKMHLVKRYSSSAKYGDEIELHDPVKALELIGKNNGALGNLKDTLLDKLDMDKLTVNQLEALARGEDILHVLLNP
jgi:phage terminase small subunit